MSTSPSDRPPDRRGAHPVGEPKSQGNCRLEIEVAFNDVDERHAQTVAAEMIARAHQLANRPEHECDVDVSVQVRASDTGADLGEPADQVVLAPVVGPSEDIAMPMDGQLAPRASAGRRAAAS